MTQTILSTKHPWLLSDLFCRRNLQKNIFAWKIIHSFKTGVGAFSAECLCEHLQLPLKTRSCAFCRFISSAITWITMCSVTPCLGLSLAFLAFITLYPRERFIRQNRIWLSIGGFKIKATFTNEIMLSVFLISVRTHHSCKIS